MNLLNGAKSLIELNKDYTSMNADEKKDFFQSKCDYYQNYVGIITIAAALFSLIYLIPDYMINGSIKSTLFPRLSILLAIALFIIITNYAKSRAVNVFMDYFLVHAMALVSIWTIYNLDDKTNAGVGLITLNIAFMVVGFASRTSELLIACLVYVLEILISDRFIMYDNTESMIILQLFCIAGLCISHVVLKLFYLDHYRVMQKLELAMVTDPLTQVYNRHLLERIITQNALKDINGPVAVAMLDIDFFKQVNDEHGHYTGDLTLLYIGQKLSKETHDNDYIIRYGGEEFIIILKNCDVNNACARMEQFRLDIESATDTPVPITVSVGVSRYTGDFSKTIQNVDNALYKAKNTGRNKVVVY